MELTGKSTVSVFGAVFATLLVPALLIAGQAQANPQGVDTVKVTPTSEGHPLAEIYSGWYFRSPETQRLQEDDFENPAFLWVEQGEELWSEVDGAANKSCASCHNDAADSMATAGANMPKWNEALGKPVNLEQQINLCRTERMEAEPWKWESTELLSMTSYVKLQSRGQPVEVATDGPMKPWFDKGKEIYYTRVGQLDMACSNCHEGYYGQQIRADRLSQGQTSGFPTYRLKWQKIGSLHRRFKGCMDNIRATPYKVGSDEFLALELYTAWRGQGLPVEAPAVRN
jgi:sulfur-oxidizing protein SoxA